MDVADCSGCEHKADAFIDIHPEKDADKNKVMKINERWEALKESSHANIQSEKWNPEPLDSFHSNRRSFWRYQRK